MPISDYRELISIVNSGGGYYALFNCVNWGDKYFPHWRENNYDIAPYDIIREYKLKGFVKIVLRFYVG